jgi:uncharacterized protein (TIGR03437 family)
MALRQSRYEIRAGRPASIEAPAETLDFLAHAKTRRVSIEGMETSGLVVGPGYAPGEILLAPSLRAKPGEYTVTLSATSESGEVRQTTMNVVVEAQVTVPPSSTRPPVVLLNGWLTGFTNSCPIATTSATTFGNLAQYLVSDGVPVVYLFDNCVEDAGNTIEALGADLGAFLNTIKYDSGAQVPQIDLVAHSMGGLIARAYLAGIQANQSQTFLPPAPTLVRDLVLIATPNFGSFVAGNYVYSIATGSQSAELVPGSSFLWNLATWNQRGDDLRGVNAIAVVGNAGSYTSSSSSIYVNNNASDGLVSLTSGSLGFAYGSQLSATRVVPYCHIDPSAYTNIGLGTFACSAPGIANVTDTNQYTGQIIRSFLAGTTAWSSIGNPPASDAWLKTYGGMFFAMTNAAGNYLSDMSAVLWGAVSLASGGDTGTIFYADFASGTGDYMATSASLGTINCGSLTQPAGYSWAARCKIGAAIFSVTPLASTSPRVLTNGTTVTLNGANFGSQCSGCQVQAYPAGSSTAQALSVTSWQNSAISVKLPSSLTGLLTLKVVAAGSLGSDTIGIMVAAPSTIAVVPASLQFAYTAGGTVPAAQPIQISNSGTGTSTLSWTATASDSWLSISAASGTAPSTPSVSVSPAALSAGTYNGSIQISAAGASNSPLSVAVTLTVTPVVPAVTVTAVVNAGSYQPGIASGAWISIFGANLAQTTYLWQASDIVNGALPTVLQGVSVTVNGLPAYVDYVSPTQINALVPDDDTVGPVPVQVTAAGEVSNALTVQKSLLAPAFLTFDGTHVAALHADYSLIGAPNLLPGAVTTPAQPGEIILLYGVGFGPANPPQPSGQQVATAAPLPSAVQVTIGGQTANVAFAGLVESGLYQFNVTVPGGLPSGDAAVVAAIGGVSTQTGVLLTVQQ